MSIYYHDLVRLIDYIASTYSLSVTSRPEAVSIEFVRKGISRPALPSEPSHSPSSSA